MPVNRRQFIASTSAAAAVSALDLQTLFAMSRQTAQTPPPTAFTPMRGSIGYFTGSGGTIGWHLDRRSVVVVDAQMPATAKICLDGINERSGSRPIDCLVNTHHHGGHTAGNVVFRPAARRILAHVNVPGYQADAAAAAAKNAKPGAPAQPAPVVASVTCERSWREGVGDEVMALRHYGPAHTGGDSVVTFEKANVVHMGDLVFNRRHPFIDRPAGASIANWIRTLEAVVADQGRDEGRQAARGHREDHRPAERLPRSRPAGRARAGSGVRRTGGVEPASGSRLRAPGSWPARNRQARAGLRGQCSGAGSTAAPSGAGWRAFRRPSRRDRRGTSAGCPA